MAEKNLEQMQQAVAEIRERMAAAARAAGRDPAAVQLCAKSGTAELGPGDTPNATFSGFIRDENYPLAFIVIVEHGGAGSAAAAPIAGPVLNACVAAMDAQ